MKRITAKTLIVRVTALGVFALLVFVIALGNTNSAYANEDTNQSSNSQIQMSEDNKGARVIDAPFSLSNFNRAQKGSNREINGKYYGYSYLIGQQTNKFIQIMATEDRAIFYIPKGEADSRSININDKETQGILQACLNALDAKNNTGGNNLEEIGNIIYTSDTKVELDGVDYLFDQKIGDDVYAFVIGSNGEDVTDSESANYTKPVFLDSASLGTYDDITIGKEKTWIDNARDFLANLDWSPLYVTIKTTGVAIVVVFILGLLAAYFALSLSGKTRSILDSFFTIPMVLPPTVCGFILLFLCGSNTGFGRFFINIGFPLIFSWPATVIAAVVVSFPLMYRSALGAFENLDANLLNSAKTLGWSNAKIFRKLMMPLSWSSIAAGTVLAFARALGEFGATLFLAGNYVGITRTIPIAIYFEWMNGNNETAWFWTAIVIAVSFLVILFINIWSNRTVKYRRTED